MFSRHIRYLLIFMTGICLSLLLLTMQPSRTLAATNPITVTRQTDTVTFPKNIDFRVSATDLSSTITQGTIFIQDSNSPYNTPHIVNITTPAHTITLHSHEDISSTNFASPGTVVTYYWQLQDAQGHTYTAPSQTFTITDTRFAWQHLNQGKLQVNWYNRSENFGQIMLSQASTNLNRIAGNLGGSPLQPINLWIYQTNNDFHGSLPPGTYEWVGGIAFPKLNQASVVVQNPADITLIRDMPHELTHLLFHQLGGQNTIYTPTWFDEGLAVYNQIYHEAAMKQTFQQALKNHSLVPLNTIENSFPADANKAYLAYSQSWNLVAYMYTTFGEPKIAALIKALNNPAVDFNDELTRILGIDQNHLENQWHLSLQQPATLAPDQTNGQTLQNPASVHIASDPHAPLLILLGFFLIVMPLFGLGGLFTYQRRARVSYQTQGRFNANLPAYAVPPSTGQQVYTDTPPSLPAPYPYYPAYPPQALPDTPNAQYIPDYSVDPYTGEQSLPPTYPTYKQPPQE
jgi:Peptidase MA superfamily